MNKEYIDFAKEHEGEDTARLLLSAARYPAIDMPAAVQQIEGLRTAREKWPRLVQCETYLYPPRLNREQASSETTARYKADLLATLHPSPANLADLTGGMGMDTMAFAQVEEQVDYVERDPQLCTLMEHNLKALGIDNVRVHCADSIEWLTQQEKAFDIIYIDPARRATSGHKVSVFEDCTPNLLEHLELIRTHCHKLLIKASPMIDIDLAVRQLGTVEKVHIVAVKGECKEVLFVCGASCVAPQISCVAIDKANDVAGTTTLTFTREEESRAEGCYAERVGRYLYEPDAAVMKGGPYKLLCQWYKLGKLARNSHLYTSDQRVEGFPGRVFEVLQEAKLNKKEIQTLIPEGKAHVVTRNYPLEAAVLQHQLGLTEGGDKFVIATSMGKRKCGFLCKI